MVYNSLSYKILLTRQIRYLLLERFIIYYTIILFRNVCRNVETLFIIVSLVCSNFTVNNMLILFKCRFASCFELFRAVLLPCGVLWNCLRFVVLVLSKEHRSTDKKQLFIFKTKLDNSVVLILWNENKIKQILGFKQTQDFRLNIWWMLGFFTTFNEIFKSLLMNLSTVERLQFVSV